MEKHLLYDAVVISNNIKQIHLCAVGNKFDRIHSIANEYYEKLSDEVDYIAELYKELGYDVENFNNATEYSSIKVLNKKQFDWDSAISWIYKFLSEYIASLVNFRNSEGISDDIKSELDTMIRYWKKENDYKNVHRIKEV